MRNIFLLTFTTFIFNAYSATPNWSLNPASFQFQMTVSSRVSIRCNDLNNRTVLVGAFVNGVCRGLDSNHVLVSGYYNTYITVYSDVQTGENVVFKLYDPSTDIIYDVLDTITFENNKNISSSVYPYLFMSNYRPELISLSQDKLYKTLKKDTKIADLSTIDKYNNTFTYSIVSNTNNNDSYFYITGNSLYLNKDLIADTITKLKVLIQTDDMNGCTYDSLFKFTILNDDPPPTGLVANDSIIVEHMPIGTLAKKLIAIDLSPTDQFTYELVPGPGSEGNSKFQINGDQLVVNSDLEYDVARVYPIRIKITDIAKNSKEVSISIVLKEIVYYLKTTDSSINEHVEIGTVAKVLEVQDVAYGGSQYTFSFKNGTGVNDNFRYIINGNKLLVNTDIEYDSSDVHSIQIQITNSAGNHIEQSFKIKIKEIINTNLPLKANNLVTPNGDGINDVFEIFNNEMYGDFKLTIFDDNGYETNTFNNEHNTLNKYSNTWNGTSDKGIKLSTGVYYYYFSTLNGDRFFKGSIYLLQP
jgi:gliding motility-associated-like protein